MVLLQAFIFGLFLLAAGIALAVGQTALAVVLLLVGLAVCWGIAVIYINDDGWGD